MAEVKQWLGSVYLTKLVNGLIGSHTMVVYPVALLVEVEHFCQYILPVYNK